MYVFSTKILTFWTFRDNLLIQLHSTANFLHLAVFKNLKVFLRITILFSKSQFLNVLRNITSSVAFYSKFATFINFLKSRIFLFGKTHPLFLRETPIFWTFWEFLQFQWPCSATFLLLAILGKARIFSKYQCLFFQKKTKVLNVLRDLTNSIAFLIKLINALSGFRNNPCFFWKTNLFFKKKTIF